MEKPGEWGVSLEQLALCRCLCLLLPALIKTVVPLHDITETVLSNRLGTEREHGRYDGRPCTDLAIVQAEEALRHILAKLIMNIEACSTTGADPTERRVYRQLAEI